jgi:hypothetical protein
MEHSSDDAFPFGAATTNAPDISPAESDERRAAAAAKKSHKDVEKRLGICPVHRGFFAIAFRGD